MSRNLSLGPFLPTLAILIAAWFIFSHLGDFSLLTPDEGRNAEVGREMKVSGSWLVPTYDGATYLDKPAFFFKAVGLSLQAFGDTEAAARLPSALFAFALILVTFAFCRRVYDLATAAIICVIAASTPLFFAFSKIVIFDMTLAFFVCSAIFSSYLAEETDNPTSQARWYALSAACAGVATIVKGPVGFLVPMLVMTAFNWIDGRTAAIRRFFTLRNALIFLVVVLPWFFGLSLACPDFPYYGIMKESIARFTTTEFRRTQPWYFYGLILATCFFPWSLALPAWAPIAWKGRGRLSRPDRLWIVWLVVVVLFFSVSQSKLPGYILSAAIAVAAIVGRFMLDALRHSGHPAANPFRWIILSFALFSLIISLSLIVHAPKLNYLEITHWLKPDTTERFLPLFPKIMLSFAIPAGLALTAFFSRSLKLGFIAMLALPVMLIALSFGVISKHADIKSARPLLSELPEGFSEQTKIACLGCLPSGLPFYLKRSITVFTVDGHELTSNYVTFSLNSGKDRPETLVLPEQLRNWLNAQRETVWLIAETSRKGELDAIAREYRSTVNSLGRQYVSTLISADRSH
jgi:4-amino-4-deoxy-L-arabinose transferase-like glycosyltransferase